MYEKQKKCVLLNILLFSSRLFEFGFIFFALLYIHFKILVIQEGGGANFKLSPKERHLSLAYFFLYYTFHSSNPCLRGQRIRRHLGYSKRLMTRPCFPTNLLRLFVYTLSCMKTQGCLLKIINPLTLGQINWCMDPLTKDPEKKIQNLDFSICKIVLL